MLFIVSVGWSNLHFIYYLYISRYLSEPGPIQSDPSDPDRFDQTSNLFFRLPSEILVKILLYLDASSLFCITHVSKLFHQLASDK